MDLPLNGASRSTAILTGDANNETRSESARNGLLAILGDDCLDSFENETWHSFQSK